MNDLRRRLLILAWWLLLATSAWSIARALVVDADLRSFMPPAQDADQKFLLQEIGAGPASQLLLVAIGDADAKTLARLSAGLAESLRHDELFAQALNGDADLTQLDSVWLPYRYLLSPTLDTATFDSAFLRDELQQRIEDLAAPASDALEEILPRDPTLETLKLAQRWSPARLPPTREGVWFSDRNEALLVMRTKAPGFDSDAQAQAIASLRAAYQRLPDAAAARLTISGPGYFSVEVANMTRADAERLTLAGTLGFVVLLLFAYRGVGVLALVALPLASGAAAGLATIIFVFGHAHGITLAFGFTLLGVAQEYPIRLLSHRRAGVSVQASAAAIWPLLRLAIVSACIAYAAFYASGVSGLQQLAVFTVTALLVAGAATRWALPIMLPKDFSDAADQRWTESLRRRLASMPRPRWLPWLLLAVALGAMWLAPAPWWQNDLAALAPVPRAELQREEELRRALGAPDVRYLLMLEATSADGVLALSEKVASRAESLVESHAVDDVELPSRYLPSLATQGARQAKLPEQSTLARDLNEALSGLPFAPDTFAPFLADVETARTLPLLTPEQFQRSPFGARLQGMLLQLDGRWFGLATLSGVHDVAAVAELADANTNVRLLDLKAASENLIAQYRQRVLQALAIALALLVAAVTIAFRDVRRAWHVIAPMSLATLLVIAVLRVGGGSLSLFHLIALTLAAGLGLHYALFFERPVADAAEARRTLHATVVCVVSAVLVFGLLAMSSVPVLRAIGLTVALGVAFHFCLSTQMAKARDAD